jgi:hypothetical protein
MKKQYLINIALCGSLFTQVSSTAYVFMRHFKTGNLYGNLLCAYVAAISLEIGVYLFIHYGKKQQAVIAGLSSFIINLIYTGKPVSFGFDYAGDVFLDLIVPVFIIQYSFLAESKGLKVMAQKATQNAKRRQKRTAAKAASKKLVPVI